MKKWSTAYLLRTSVTSLSFSFIIISTPVYGADGLTEQVCSDRPPTCSALGYSTASCPSGSSALLCPLDKSYKICIPNAKCDAQLYTLSSCPQGATCKSCNGKYRVLSCGAGQHLNSNLSCESSTSCNFASVGDYVYNDHTCGTQLRDDTVGIIIDPIRRIFMNIYSSGTGWNWNVSDDIAGIPNYTSASSAVSDFDGKAHTLVLFNMEYSSNPTYHSTTHVTPCYDWTMNDEDGWNETVSGNTSNMDYYGWYLPALGELSLLAGLKDTLNAKLPVSSTDPLGYDAGDDEILLSSTEADANDIWGFKISEGRYVRIPKIVSNNDPLFDDEVVRCFHKY